MNCCNTNAENQTMRAATPAATFRPNADIVETPDEFVIRADVPGASAESIDLRVEDGLLTVRAAVKPRTGDNARRIVAEYGIGDFERTFRVGDGVDAGAIAAECKDGVLTLRLPKAETLKARKIQVRAM